MTPYILMILSLLLFQVIFGVERIRTDRKLIFLIFALTPVFVLLGFRGEPVGADTEAYTDLFNEVQFVAAPEQADERLEVGYLYFSKWVADYFGDVQWLFILTGLFICVSIGWFIYHNAKDPALALLLFITLGFFQFALSGVRQTLAISITLWIYPFIKQKKLIFFLIGLFIATLFHKSALFFLPAYFMARQSLNAMWIIVELVVFSIVFFFATNYLLLFTADIMDYEYGIEETGNGFVFFAAVLLITLAGVLSRSRLLEQNPANKNILNLNFISFALWSVRLVSRTAERVTFYYMPYTYVLLEEYVLSIPKTSTRRLIYWAVVVASISLFLYRVSYDTTLTYVFA